MTYGMDQVGSAESSVIIVSDGYGLIKGENLRMKIWITRYLDNEKFVHGYVDNKEFVHGYVRRRPGQNKNKPLLLLIQVLLLILRFYHLIKFWMETISGRIYENTVLMQMNVSILFVVLLNSR